MFNIGQKLTKENYTAAAVWCAKNKAHIEKQNGAYIIVGNAPAPEQPAEQKVAALEAKYGLARPVRTALLELRSRGAKLDETLMAHVDEIETEAISMRTTQDEEREQLSAILYKNKTPILLHCDTYYEQNEGCAEITKSRFPTSTSQYKVRYGFGGFVSLTASDRAANGVNWFNVGGLTLTDTDKYSVECLVKPAWTENKNRCELVFGTGSTPDAIWRFVVERASETSATVKIFNGDNSITHYESEAGAFTSSDSWYHLAATYHGNGTWSSFVNGTKVGTFAAVGASTGYNFTFLHGVARGSDMGCFDEIAVHSYERYTKDFVVPTQPYIVVDIDAE